jgi:hypothetical protein
MKGTVAWALAALVCLSAADAAADCGRFSGCETAPPSPEPKPTPIVTPRPTPTVTVTPRAQTDPCAGIVSVRQGVMTLQVQDGARAGQMFDATVDNVVYAAPFDAAGRTQLEAPLFHTVSEVLWQGAEGQNCRRSGVLFDGFNSTYEAALIWDGEYDLSLRVVEPDGGFDSPSGFITPDKPNLDLNAGHGGLRKFGVAAPGASRVWLYSIPPGGRPTGTFAFWVDFASRGNPVRPPYCEGQAQPTATFRLWVDDAGSTSMTRKLNFKSEPCGYRFSSHRDEWYPVKP